MADVKISQLPVATTPVDGTEVLPIVQSATTKQVSIANLTAGRAMAASSLTLTTPLAVTSGGTGLATTAAGTLLSSTALNTISATATPTLGVAGTAAGTLGLSGSTSGIVTLATAATAGTWTFTLPTSGGTNGFILTTNGSGVTTWTNPTALGVDLDVGSTAITGGTTGRVLYNNAGVLGEYSSVPVSFGGTGLTSLTAGYIPYGNGTGAFSNSSSLTFSGSALSVAGSINGAWDGGQYTQTLTTSSYIPYLTQYGWTGGGSNYYATRIANSAGSIVFQLGTQAAVGSNTFTEAMRLDASGNLGLGVTPSAWNGKAFEFGYAGSALFTTTYSQSILTANTYYASTGYKYAASSIGASYYSQYAGVHSWYNAPSGTAGNAISFTQAMTLDASGNLNTYGTITANANVSGQGCYISRNGSDGGGVVGTAANASLSFTTNSTERARIDASGNLLVGTTVANPVSSRENGLSYSTGSGFILRGPSTTSAFGLSASSGNHISFYTDNGSAAVLAGSISSNGSTTTYGQGSDYRLKNNIISLPNALSRVNQLNPVGFNWKEDGTYSEGFIAHELQSVFPYAVFGEKDGSTMQQVDYGKLTPLLAAAIQELAAKVSALEAKQQ